MLFREGAGKTVTGCRDKSIENWLSRRGSCTARGDLTTQPPYKGVRASVTHSTPRRCAALCFVTILHYKWSRQLPRVSRHAAVARLSLREAHCAVCSTYAYQTIEAFWRINQLPSAKPRGCNPITILES